MHFGELDANVSILMYMREIVSVASGVQCKFAEPLVWCAHLFCPPPILEVRL